MTTPDVLQQTSSPSAIVRVLWRAGWPLAVMLQFLAFSEAMVIYWLGRLLGPPALAIEATVRHLFASATFTLGSVGMGVMVMVSHSVGARDERGLAIAGNGLALTTALWLAAVAIVLPLGGPIGDALGSAELVPGALRSYATPWLLLSLPGTTLLFVLLSAATGAGWTRLTMSRSIADIVLTAITVPFAISVLDLGIAGAPIAIGCVQLVLVLVVARALLARRDAWHLGKLPPVRGWFDRRLWLQLLHFGLPSQLARVAMLASYAYLVQRVARDGRAAVAGYGVAVLLMFIAFNLTSAIGRATGILVGQLAGARAWARVAPCVRTALLLALAVGVVPIAAYATLGRPLASLFASDGVVIEHAATALRVISLAIPFTAISQLLLFVLTGLKVAKLPGILGVLADGLGIAFAVLSPGDHQLTTVAWSIVLSNAARAFAYLLLWRNVVAHRLAQQAVPTA